MPTDWGKLITAIIGVAGPPAAAAILGNRSQGNALELSQENLTTARDKSIDAVRDYVAGAKPFIDWNYEQGMNGQDWAFDNAQNAQNWALTNASKTRGNALQSALDALNQGFTGAQSYLTPYSSTGENALTRLNSRAGGARGVNVAGPTGSASSGAPFKFNFAAKGETPLPPAVKPYPTATPGTGATAAGMPEFKMPGATGSGGGGSTNALQNILSQQKVQGPGLGSALGGAVGSVAGGLIGSGAGALPSLGLGALGGPIGMAVGALVGPLVGHFTRRGREKEGASKVANDLGTWIENLYTQQKSGQITPEVFQAAVIEGKRQYDQWIDANLKDDFVKQNSKTDQAKWINQSMQQKGFNFTVS